MGVVRGDNPATCSVSASASGIGQKNGAFHQACVNGTVCAFHHEEIRDEEGIAWIDREAGGHSTAASGHVQTRASNRYAAATPAR